MPEAFILKRNKKSKRITIRVKPDGTVSVSAPKKFPKFLISMYVRQKKQWILDAVEKVLKQTKGVRLSRSEERAQYIEYKNKALKLVTERLKHFNTFYNFTYHKITIRNQKSRWGSCSVHGNLNFTYKIALLPQHLADYIIVHELCHRGEFNHSQKFWQLVERTMPDWKLYRKELHEKYSL